MVVKALYDAWRSGQVMRHMYNELLQMLEACEWMFATSAKVLFDGEDPGPVKDDLYDTDRMVNRCERRIRKELVEHLTLRPSGDLPAGLVLMSLIKDAERIGDYCKNLFEIRELLGSPFAADETVGHMREAYERTLQRLGETRKAVAEGDDALARKLMGEEKRIAREIETLVRDVADSDMPTRQAVSRALFLRHVKRIDAHLTNIASSVVQPVHRIDYREKKKSLKDSDDKAGGE